jgi:hypothetical protein
MRGSGENQCGDSTDLPGSANTRRVEGDWRAVESGMGILPMRNLREAWPGRPCHFSNRLSVAEKTRMKIDDVIAVRWTERRRVSRQKQTSSSILKVEAGGNELIGLLVVSLAVR